MEATRAHLDHCHLFNEYSWALFKLKDGSLDLCICPSQQSVVFLMKAEKHEHIIVGNVMSNSASNDYGVIKGSGCLISGNNLSESFSVCSNLQFLFILEISRTNPFIFLFYKSPNTLSSIYKYYVLKVLRKVSIKNAPPPQKKTITSLTFQHLVQHLLWAPLLHLSTVVSQRADQV